VISSRYFLICLLLFFLTLTCSLFSQTEDGESAAAAENSYQSTPEIEALLDAALSSAESGNWEEALSILDEAERMDPLDPRVYSYRSSIE
jgi:Flp pilus assembly protein TadD